MREASSRSNVRLFSEKGKNLVNIFEQSAVSPKKVVRILIFGMIFDKALFKPYTVCNPYNTQF